MNSLIASNLTHHPGRTVASILGIAVGVILVVLTVGLVRGQLRARGVRDANIGVEIMLRRSGQGLSPTSADMVIPVTALDTLRSLPGVAAVTPVGQQLEMGGEGGLGLLQIDGIDYKSFTAATKLRLKEGRPLPASGDFAIVDFQYARDHRAKLGDKIAGLGRSFTIVGIYEPEIGPRIKVPLATMQEAMGAEDKCSMIFVKCQKTDEQELVAQRIVDQFPEYRVIFTRDLPTLFASGFAGFNVFFDIVKGLATVISLLVILLTMYSTVSERTRQIGILKSLGASKFWIAWTFEKEAMLISLVGVLGGLAVAVVARFLLVNFLGWTIDLEPSSIIYASIAGMLSGALGALYPAFRAASQDPVDALSYE
ncbi:MAG: ABC transporter permease [Blastocatellia bacterium]|nr:ABC transporter permease [Blastocatellia bacterium]